MNTAFLIAASYFIGSIPFSYLGSRLKGHDPRKKGTKNVGASNALLVAGPLAGMIGILGDIGKGFFVVWLARYYSMPYFVVVLSGLAAIVGHDFSIFLKFKGGKGVATSLGVILAIDPVLSLIILLIWCLVLAVTRYLILSSLICFLLLPLLVFVAGLRSEYFWLTLVMAGLALFAHRKDIDRFVQGREVKVSESLRRLRRRDIID